MSADKHFIPSHTMRRKAPLHFLAKADNARFTAYLMQSDAIARDEAAADAISYSGAQSIARNEAFLREAAISLELVIKATIAQKIETGEAAAHVLSVKTTHNIPILWDDAGLPQLSNPDKRLLIFVRRILFWSGRYAAPRDDEMHLKDRAEENALRPPQTKSGILNFQKGITFRWEEFDRLYKIVFSEFVQSRQKFESQFGAFS